MRSRPSSATPAGTRMHERARYRIGVATVIVACAFVVAGAAPALSPPTEPPVAIEATALVPVDSESVLSIVGLHGQIAIGTHDDRDLRVISREPGPNGAELPVGIWQVGTTMVIALPPGDKGAARAVRIQVPRTFAITVDAADSDVSVDSVGGGVEVRGRNTSVNILSAGGYVSVDLEGGALTVSASDDATLRLRGTALEVANMSGNVTVKAVGGSLSLRGILGSTDVESDESKVTLDDLSGSTHLKARNGDATVTGIKAGAEFEMSGTPLHLKDGRGDITVTSDAPVDFLGMAASLHFDLYGGSLRGKGNQGILEVRTHNTEVTVESIDQGMRVQGEGLKAKIADIAGELYIETKTSEVTIERVASVILNVDRGNVSVQGATGAVRATVTDGDVHLIDGNGPVTLELDRGDAEVSWASLSWDKDSTLTNTSGNVTVRFPAAGACRVEAKSTYGRVDSDLPTVRVMDDLTEAQGPVNFGNRPIVNIVAHGDIHLQGAAKAHDAN
jgi:DUF4097 and DUF4098 domain-containing protein YvlB